MKINDTGIRTGEMIIGIGPQTSGTLITVEGFYPPSKPWVDKLSEVQIRDELSNLAFFKPMSIEQRGKWLNDNATMKDDLYMEDVPGIKIKFHKIGGKFFGLHPEISSELLQAGFLNIVDVFNMFPKKPGSRARKHTLVFRPTNWQVMPVGVHQEESFHGIIFDLDTYAISNVSSSSTPSYVFKDPALNIGINKATTILTKSLTREHLIALASTIYDMSSSFNAIFESMDWFPPSLHKSLIQKLIRTRATEVHISGISYLATDVLVASIISLILHSGSFVPDIQRYVTGIESAFKRVAVSICEDGYVAPEYEAAITMMFAVSLVVQDNRDFVPSDSNIQYCLSLALMALTDGHCYDYRSMITTPNTALTPLYFSYLLLGRIGSFKSDVEMMRNIASSSGRFITGPTAEPYVFEIYRAIDHHVFTNIAYCIPIEISMEYPELFNWLWEASSKYNPRKQGYGYQIPPPILEGQRLMWLMKAPRQCGYESAICPGTIQYSLDPNYLVGLIGSHIVKINGKDVIVVLRDGLEFRAIAVKHPSRNEKEIKTSSLTDDEKELASSMFKAIIAKGLEVDMSSLGFGNCIIGLDEADRFIIKYVRNGISTIDRWDKVVNITVDLPSTIYTYSSN